MTYKITFTRPGMLHAAMICQSTESVRPYLCGVHVAPRPAGGLFVVSTDGHRLSLGLDREATVTGDLPDGGETLAIPKAGLAKLKEGRTSVAVDYDRASERLTIGDTAYLCPPVGGTFPDWTRTLPPRAGLVPPPLDVGFNAASLADFGRIGKGFGQSHPWLRLAKAEDDPRGPCWVDLGEPDWRGVLMSIRWVAKGALAADFT